jgi:putative ubiquitin-RnfH superfamily antitoxin RatB of RatAB toxin-antitoxin module
MDRADAPSLTLCVAYSPRAGEVDSVELVLPAGATLADALRASGVLERHPGIDLEIIKLGIWGKLATLDAPLRDGDRVELYRPLAVDPKEARRLRYRSHRERVKQRG